MEYILILCITYIYNVSVEYIEHICSDQSHTQKQRLKNCLHLQYACVSHFIRTTWVNQCLYMFMYARMYTILYLCTCTLTKPYVLVSLLHCTPYTQKLYWIYIVISIHPNIFWIYFTFKRFLSFFALKLSSVFLLLESQVEVYNIYAREKTL